MSVTYLFRGVFETKGGEKIMHYEGEVSELGKIAFTHGYKIVAQMLSTQNFAPVLARPLYECDIVKIEGEKGDFIVEHSARKMAFVLSELRGEKEFYLFDKIDLVCEYKGTLYDKDISLTYGESVVTL